MVTLNEIKYFLTLKHGANINLKKLKEDMESTNKINNCKELKNKDIIVSLVELGFNVYNSK